MPLGRFNPLRWVRSRRRSFGAAMFGVGIGVVMILGMNSASNFTSTNEFCDSCHVHPHSTITWKGSTHYKNKSGVVVNCVQCHLPPKGMAYYTEKVKTGARDVYGVLMKDPAEIDWEAKTRLEHAVNITYDESCLHCHVDLYSLNLTKKGIEAHDHYIKSQGTVRCINCHIAVGHLRPERVEPPDPLLPTSAPGVDVVRPPLLTRHEGPVEPQKFENFLETIPGTSIQFEMMAIPGGVFELGTPPDEKYRQPDEGPVRKVKVSPFWMGKWEVTWREFEEFYSQTATMGKNDPRVVPVDADAITGPTPPYGSPDQGWGKGDRPAITMTHHGAMVYTRWLSEVTGRKFRLPTEAEWEYACRAGSTGPYFFEGSPTDFTTRYWLNRIFGVAVEPIGSFAWYEANSRAKTHPHTTVQANPWGLVNMLGNVREFCLDFYDANAYAAYPAGDVVEDPRGPESGTERVVRGGSYRTDAADLRIGKRDHTRHDAWMRTDPQSPKSIWWYSDCKDVGFRVVLEYEGEEEPGT
jgi:formylglycine-generating enzyme